MSAEPARQRHDVLKYVDTIAKLAAACAIVAASVIASNYESRTTGLSLLNQREQSESRCARRCSRISSTRSSENRVRGNQSIENASSSWSSCSRFHGHFEFKPLLLDVDDRLVGSNLEVTRDELSSVARRVIEREINTLNAAQLGIDGRELSVDNFGAIETSRLIPAERLRHW